MGVAILSINRNSAFSIICCPHPSPLSLRELSQSHREREYIGGFIAIHRKFQTRRVAEDSTRLYGEATQHRMRLSVDGYTCSRSHKKTGFPRL